MLICLWSGPSRFNCLISVALASCLTVEYSPCFISVMNWGKPIRCTAKPLILSFSPTRLINSIIYEHSCKILYVLLSHLLTNTIYAVTGRNTETRHSSHVHDTTMSLSKTLRRSPSTVYRKYITVRLFWF